MIETVGVDGDIVAYRCAATAEGQPEDIALYRIEELMNRIVHETNARQHKVFLSGANNFRYDIFPAYKLHRVGKPKPQHLERSRQYLVEHWGASISDGYEADDSLGIFQTDLESCIASIDKDLLQIPGHHYNFVRQEFIFVSPFDALRNFYSQVITGDGADGVPAFDGKIRNGIPKFVQRLLDPLQEITEEYEMYKYALSIYEDHYGFHFDDPAGKTMHRNAKVLYIMRKEGDYWEPPVPGDTNQDSKHM
jgi:hypothetical protein